MDNINKLIEKALNQVQKDRLVAIASELIQIPIVTVSEGKFAQKAFELLKEKKIDVERYERSGKKERPNIVSFVNKGEKPLFSFNGHIDTVPIGNRAAWEHDPYKPYTKNGNLFGRGAIDMKGGCAAIMHTMEILHKLNEDIGFKGGVRADLVVGEEGDREHGTVELVEYMKKDQLTIPDFHINAEKSNLKIRNAERGGVGLNIKFLGHSTHTCLSRVEGVNAISNAAKAIISLIKQQPDKFDPSVGYPVFSINRILAESSLSGNQVPSECSIFIDYRQTPSETKEEVIQEFIEKLDKLSENDPDFKYEIGEIRYIPSLFMDPESDLIKVLKKNTRLVTGKKAEFMVDWSGGTEQRSYYNLGCQTVGFGPIGGHAHGPNEWVDINSLVLSTKVYLATTLELLNHKQRSIS